MPCAELDPALCVDIIFWCDKSIMQPPEEHLLFRRGHISTLLLALSCASEEKADHVGKHSSPVGYGSPQANSCLPSEQGLCIHSRCALPTLLNTMTLSLKKANIDTLNLGSPAASSPLFVSHPPAPGLSLLHLLFVWAHTSQ